MIRRRIQILTTVLLLATAPLLAGEPSFELDEDEKKAPGKRTVVVSSAKELAEAGVAGRGTRKIARKIQEILKDQPEGTKVRVVIGEITEGSVRWRLIYAKSVAPLDDKGRPHGVEHMVTGLKTGVTTPAVLRKVPWKHGVRHGIAKEYVGKKLVAEVPWEEGKIDGVRKSYYRNGQIQSKTHYVDDQAHGPVRTWNKEGELIKKGTFKNGKRHGKFTEYWPGTEKPRRIIQYRNGYANGVVREYYLSGKLRRKRTLVDGVLHGRDISYNEKGKVTGKRYWFDGDPVTRKEFKRRAKKQKQKAEDDSEKKD
ncbi:MAG: toxin-antitoxin system YwqK family antitoxin [Planctomycetes bacterium]|nr:toxin-antitoxin system YwqK family antitoxin [Planctomycetota bacterium]